MIIYSDFATGDEVLSEPVITKTEGIFFEAKASMIYEDGADPEDPESEKVLSIPYRFSLMELEGFSKKLYLATLKSFLKSAKKYLKKTMNEEELAAWQTAVQEHAQKVIENFDDYAFYTSSSMNMENGPIIYAHWEGADCVFYYYKDLLTSQKV